MAISQEYLHKPRESGYKNHQPLIIGGVITGLVLVMLAISWLSKRGITTLDWILAGALGFMVFAVFLYRFARYEYATLAIALAGGLTNFFTLPTGRDSRIVLSLLIALGMALVWVLQLLTSKHKLHIKPSLITKPTFLFAVVSIIAYVWSNLMRDPLVFVPDFFPFVQLGALAVIILLPLLALMVSNVVEDVRWLKLLTWAVIALGTFIIICVFAGNKFSALYSNGYRGLFATWVVALAYAMLLFNEELPLWTRGLLLVLVVGWFYQDFILHGDWFSGWLPMVVAMAVITFTRSKKLFALLMAVTILIFATHFNYFYQHYYVANYYNQGGNQRAGLWSRNLQLVERHPLFGMGPAGYAVYYMTYNPDDARSTHNNYFDILAQTGVIGFGIYIWLLVSFGRLGNRVRRALSGRRNFEEAFANATLAGLFGALAGMMLGDWVIPFAYNQTISGFDNASYTWIFLGGMVALYLIVMRRNRFSFSQTNGNN